MRRVRNNKQGGRVPTKKSRFDVLHRDLVDLKELSKAQEVKFVPEVPDVPRIRFKPSRVFNFELSYNMTFSTSTTLPTLNSLIFTLNSAPSDGRYTAVFDQYRIVQANVKFIPTQNSTLVGSPGNGGVLYTVLDYDDGGTPSALSSLFLYDTLMITPGGTICERTVNPRIASAVYSGAFSSYANLSNMTWIDTISDGVQYYGLKYGIAATTTVETITVVVSMMVQFKRQKSA